MNPKPLPSLVELEEVFEVTDKYPSGLLWKINPSLQGGKKAGSMAGALGKNKNAYWRVKYKQISYPCHRIRWSLINKRLVLPTEFIDHVNLDIKDNRGELRLVTRSQNQYNRTRKKASSGYRWVVHTNKNLKKPWRIMMKINGKTEYFGYYADPKEAAEIANQIAIEKLNTDYIKLNFQS
jgi:hypothetical protein